MPHGRAAAPFREHNRGSDAMFVKYLEVGGRHMTEEGWVNNVVAGERVVYVRDDRTGRFFSAGFAPVFRPYRSYRCGSGLNYQIVENVTDGLRVTWRIYIPLGKDPLGIWDLRVENLTRRPRRPARLR